MIEVTNLTKKYGRHTALDNISFTVDKGEILGFLGPNGAGKTTAMNILTGYIAATAGDVRIDGIDIVERPKEAKARIGYLPDNPPVYGDMRVDEYLRFAAELKGLTRAARRTEHRDIRGEIDEIKAVLHIEDMGRRLIKNLSKGYRQRVGLAQAMLGAPKVIIMDEPTVGLDPKQIIEMREVIRGLGERHTVILSSHIMQEVSAVCDRVMIINRGAIVAGDTPQNLAEALRPENTLLVRVKAARETVLEALAVSVPVSVKELPCPEEGACDFEISGGGDSGVDLRVAVFRCMAEGGWPILMMKPVDYSLEEIFLQVTAAPSATESVGTRRAVSGHGTPQKSAASSIVGDVPLGVPGMSHATSDSHGTPWYSHGTPKAASPTDLQPHDNGEVRP